jgi:hypothetical protein
MQWPNPSSTATTTININSNHCIGVRQSQSNKELNSLRMVVLGRRIPGRSPTSLSVRWKQSMKDAMSEFKFNVGNIGQDGFRHPPAIERNLPHIDITRKGIKHWPWRRRHVPPSNDSFKVKAMFVAWLALGIQSSCLDLSLSLSLFYIWIRQRRFPCSKWKVIVWAVTTPMRSNGRI